MKPILAAGLGALLVAGFQPIGAQAAPEAPRPAGGESLLDPFATATALRGYRIRGISADVISLVLDQPAGGGLAVEALAVPLGRDPDDETGKARVALLVEIAGAPFLEYALRDRAETARLEVYAYAFSGRTVATYLANIFAVDLTALGEAIWQSGLKLYADLDLAPGEYTLRVLVRHYPSTAFGLVEQPLIVSPGPAVAGPLLPGPKGRDSWLPMRAWTDPAAGSLPYPFAIGDQALVPEVQPVLMTGQKVEAFLVTAAAERRPSGKIEVLTRGAELSKVAEVGFRAGEPRPIAWGGSVAWPIEIELPARLRAGRYVLRLQGRGGQPFLLIAADPQNRDLLWSDLSSSIGGGVLAPPRTAETAPPAAMTRRSGRGRGRRIKKLSEEYRALLRRWTADQGSGGEAVMGFEQELLVSAGRGGVEALKEAELAVAGKLARQEPDSLVPIIAFHDSLLPLYSHRRIFALSSHTRVILESLVDLYVEQGGSPPVAAPALSHVGGLLQVDNLVSGSRHFFSRALELDPEQRCALLGLAVSAEKFGEYGQAFSALERLVAAHPELDEAVLRLAINSRRTGRVQLSRELLDRVLKVATLPWVRALAYEEVARTRLAAGAIDEAADLLEKACRELPGRSGLTLLLAHLRDRQGRSLNAFDLVDEITPVSDASGSPRRIYDDWPRSVVEESAAALKEAAGERLPTLARILSTEDRGD